MYIRKKSPAKQRFAKELTAKYKRNRQLKEAALSEQEVEPRGTSLESWFLGPKAENMNLFENLLKQALDSHREYRTSYFPNDPIAITDAIKNDQNFQQSLYGQQGLLPLFQEMLQELQGSAPFHSYRWQSHMNGDLTMPGMLGYMATLLYNPNNVAAEASPVTTQYEIEVGNDLCEMLGYSVDSALKPWGHITCDGSVANLEAMWAARNVKFYAVSLAQALKREPAFEVAKTLTVRLLNGQVQPLINLDTWTLLNLRMDDVLVLPEELKALLGKKGDNSPADQAIDALFDQVMGNYLLQKLGMLDFYQRFMDNLPTPVILGPASMHYSWPKAAAVLGIGAQNLLSVHVDLDGRQKLEDLKLKLMQCLLERRPVLQVVAVIGSTEESAVDPLEQLLEMREGFRLLGMDYAIHADCAWGGYFASILREPQGPVVEDYRTATPALGMSDYVTAQYRALGRADSITVDPHKAGFLPYPAGGLCYRNSALRNVVSFTAPVVYHGGVDPTVGVYGIEGSKPGAAAAGAYLSHRVVGTDRYGYGQLLGKGIFNSKRFYAALLSMVQEDDPFIVVPFHRLPAEREGKSEADVQAQLEYIKQNMGTDRSNEQIMGNEEVKNLFLQLGSDHNIVPYMFNFKTENGLNEDIELMGKLNDYVFKNLSLAPAHDELKEIPMIVTSSQFETAAYGEEFMNSLKTRLGVKGDGPIEFIITTTTNPFVTEVETPEGIMLGTIVKALRETVLEGVKVVQKEAKLLV